MPCPFRFLYMTKPWKAKTMSLLENKIKFKWEETL